MSAFILPGILARVAAKEEAPVWRVRIAEAVAQYGQLAEVARSAKMTSSQLQKIANGTTRDPSVTTLDRVAKAMGITLSALVDERARPEHEAGVGERPSASAEILEEIRLRELDRFAPAEDSTRGDILRAQTALDQAHAALNRALRRSNSKSGAA